MFFTILPKDGFLKGILKGFILAIFVHTVSVSSAEALHYVNPELKPYVDDYMIMVKNNCRPDQYYYPDHTALFIEDIPQDPDYKEDSDPRIVGQCGYTSTYFHIYIDTKFFRQATIFERKAVIFHELRHCLFHLDQHNKDPNSYFNDKVPDILEPELYSQVIDDLMKSCGGK
jgi:hypothetical protein